MPYSDKTVVETWSQISSSDLGSAGYDYTNTIQYLIGVADRAIDDYLNQPDNFFNPDGVEIQQEYHDGVEIGDYGLIISFGLSVKRRPFLRLDHSPVLSVTKLEKSDSSGTWSTMTEGRTSDYLVMDTGIRFIRGVPTYDYKNVRCTYKAGYKTTPGRIAECSARLAAAMAQRIIDVSKREDANVSPLNVAVPLAHKSLGKAVFTKELKELVRRYKRKVSPKLL